MKEELWHYSFAMRDFISQVDAHHRRSIRLRGFDYASCGLYFVTMCVRNKECLFGNITNGVMHANEEGRIVENCWKWLGDQYPYVNLDAWIMMPNHFHGIISIHDDFREGICRGGSRTAPTDECLVKHKKPLGRLIGAFKTVSTKRINQLWDTPGQTIWQRNYYERIIRGDKELENIRMYILNNPASWLEDEEYSTECTGASRSAPTVL